MNKKFKFRHSLECLEGRQMMAADLSLVTPCDAPMTVDVGNVSQTSQEGAVQAKQKATGTVKSNTQNNSPSDAEDWQLAAAATMDALFDPNVTHDKFSDAVKNNRKAIEQQQKDRDPNPDPLADIFVGDGNGVVFDMSELEILDVDKNESHPNQGNNPNPVVVNPQVLDQADNGVTSEPTEQMNQPTNPIVKLTTQDKSGSDGRSPVRLNPVVAESTASTFSLSSYFEGLTDAKGSLAIQSSVEKFVSNYLGEDFSMADLEDSDYSNLFIRFTRAYLKSGEVNLSDVDDYAGGFAYGFFVDGLYGNLEGIAFIAKQGLLLTTPGQIFTAITGYDGGRQKMIDQSIEVIKLSWSIANTLDQAIKAEAMEQFLLLLNGSNEDLQELGRKHQTFTAAVFAIGAQIHEELQKLTPYQRARIVGAISYEIAQALVEAGLTGGTSKIATGSVRLVSLLDKLKDFGRYADKFGDIAKSVAALGGEGTKLRKFFEKIDETIVAGAKSVRQTDGPHALRSMDGKGPRPADAKLPLNLLDEIRTGMRSRLELVSGKNPFVEEILEHIDDLNIRIDSNLEAGGEFNRITGVITIQPLDLNGKPRSFDDLVGTLVHEYVHSKGYGEGRAYLEQYRVLAQLGADASDQAKIAQSLFDVDGVLTNIKKLDEIETSNGRSYIPYFIDEAKKRSAKSGLNTDSGPNLQNAIEQGVQDFDEWGTIHNRFFDSSLRNSEFGALNGDWQRTFVFSRSSADLLKRTKNLQPTIIFPGRLKPTIKLPLQKLEIPVEIVR